MALNALLKALCSFRIRLISQKLARLKRDEKDAFRAVEEIKAIARDTLVQTAKQEIALHHKLQSLQRKLKSL
jgi:hypothetical protein